MDVTEGQYQDKQVEGTVRLDKEKIQKMARGEIMARKDIKPKSYNDLVAIKDKSGRMIIAPPHVVVTKYNIQILPLFAVTIVSIIGALIISIIGGSGVLSFCVQYAVFFVLFRGDIIKRTDTVPSGKIYLDINKQG
jgi:hypothetical protein